MISLIRLFTALFRIHLCFHAINVARKCTKCKYHHNSISGAQVEFLDASSAEELDTWPPLVR